MQIIRNTITRCPVCAQEIEGQLILKDNKIYITRNCPEHGPYEFKVSDHGEWYADLDNFYVNVLKRGGVKGRITNSWIVTGQQCQMDCNYCSLDVNKPRFEKMTLEDFENTISELKHSKLTLSGGEATLHPHIFDFFRIAHDKKVTTSLATNGVKLADMDFCKKLVESKLKEVRLSIESFDREQTKKLNTEKFLDAKLQALKNLEELGVVTIISPTIFRNINEDQLAASIEFARIKPNIREVSVNGFAWVGSGKKLYDTSSMIMPDEMMDIVHAKFFSEDRKNIYVFQKYMHLLMQLCNFRFCLHNQAMFFIKGKKRVIPITEYLNMKRIDRYLKRWEKHTGKSNFYQWMLFIKMSLFSMKFKALSLTFQLFNLFIANIFQIKIHKYPSKILPVLLNTNCGTLNADKTIEDQCNSGCMVKVNGQLHKDIATYVLYPTSHRK